MSGVRSYSDVRSVEFVLPSQRCSLLRSMGRPVSAVRFCAVWVAQSALFSLGKIVAPSQRCWLARNLCRLVRRYSLSYNIYCPVSAVRFCAICVTQSAPSNQQLNSSIDNHFGYLWSVRNKWFTFVLKKTNYLISIKIR